MLRNIYSASIAFLSCFSRFKTIAIFLTEHILKLVEQWAVIIILELQYFSMVKFSSIEIDIVYFDTENFTAKHHTDFRTILSFQLFT